MKYYRRISSVCLTICMVASLLHVSDVKAELLTSLTDLSDLSNIECIGSLTENFDNLTNIDTLYRKSGEGALQGTWQRSSRGKDGSAAVEDGSLYVETSGDGDWNNFSGVDFVFDKPITSNYFLEVSYEITGITENSAGAVFFNNLSDSSSAIHNVNSIGAGLWENGGFQFIKSNEEHKPVFADCWVGYGRNVTASVKTVYDLNKWTYDGTVTIGSETKQVTSFPIAPAGYDDNGGTFICSTGSAFDRLTVAVRNGISKIDNISIKAYKTKYNLIENMDFDGCKSTDDLKELGFLIKDDTISVGSAFESDEMRPSMCINNAAYGANLPVLDTAAYDGAYRISYWVYSTSAQASFVVDAPMVINSFENGSLLLLKIDNNQAYMGNLKVASLETNTWYRFEHTIGLNERMVGTAAYKADGSRAGMPVRCGFTNFTDGEADEKINHFSGIRFRNWSKTDVYVDNIDVHKAAGNLLNAYAKIDFNSPEQNTGMTQVAALNEEVERDGRKGMLMDRDKESEMYMLFDVDDKMLYDIPDETPIKVTVEYFDEGDGYFELAYDGYGIAETIRDGIWAYAECVQMTDSKEWKSYTFYVERMRMTNRAENADFRLGVFAIAKGRSPGSVVVGSVTLRTSDYHDPLRLLSVTGNKPGNIYSKGEEIGINLNFDNKSAQEVRGTFSYTVTSDDGRYIGGEDEVTCILPEWKETTLILYPPEADKYGTYYITVEGTFEDTGGDDMEPIPFFADVEYSLAWEVAKEDINDKFGTALLICEYEWSAKDGVAANLAVKAGIKWNREEIQWSRTELTPGVYKIPDDMLRELELAKEAGMNNHLGLIYANPVRYESYAGQMDPPTSENELKAYGDWCEWLARETKGLVQAFGAWNEYNIDSFNCTNESPEHYVKMLEVMYKAIKKGNPDALLLGLESAGIDHTFNERVFAVGGLQWMDVAAVHPYDWSGHFDTQKIMNDCNQMKEMMRQYNDGKEIPIWWTEFGFGTRYTLEEQRNNFVMAYALQECYDLADVTYQFRFQDDLRIGGEEKAWGLNWSYEDLGRENGAKPSYLAFCAMNNLIGANAEAKEVIKDGTTYAFRFYNKKMGKDVAVLAGEYDANYMKIKLGTKKLEVYDVYGNKLEPVESEDGVYGFVINREPVYVAGNFTSFEQVGEIEDVTSGIVKDDEIVNQLSETLPGDEVNVKLHKKLFSEDKQEGYCVLAFYDKDENLLQSVWDNISFTSGNSYWSGCTAQVPENAAFAQVFTWEYDTLIPLRKRIMIKS